MLRTGVILHVLLALTLASGVAHRPRNVLDYYLLLPSDWCGGLAVDTRSERLRLLRDFKGSYVDRQHGYLHIEGDGGQPELDVCIFKRPDGNYMVAAGSNTDSDGLWDPVFGFYEYDAGHLVSIRMPMRPRGLGRNLGLVLPRYGRDIQVVNQKGRTLYRLHWTGTGLVKRMRSRR